MNIKTVDEIIIYGCATVCILAFVLVWFVLVIATVNPAEPLPERRMGIAAPSCAEDLPHREWAECMGVPYKPAREPDLEEER